MSELIKEKGRIIEILTQKENDWGRYRLDCFGKDIIAVGIIKDAGVGMEVELEGISETTKYGRQFSIKKVLSRKSDTCAGVRKFLMDGYIKGIGPSKAEAIIKAYGVESLSLFETEEGIEKLAKIKGITKKLIEKCIPSYNENKKYKDIILLLNGMGTKCQIEKIYEKYKEDAPKIIKTDPYRLQMDIDGFGFIKADSIAMSAGVKPNSIHRLAAASGYVLEEAQNMSGHCFLTVNEVKERVIELLVPVRKYDDISEKVAKNALSDWFVNKEKLIKKYNPCAETISSLSEIAETRIAIANTLSEALGNAIEKGIIVNDDGCIYTTKTYNAECMVASILAKMCMENPVRYIDINLINRCIEQIEERKTKDMNAKGIAGVFKITEEQKDAVCLGLMHRVSIVSGGPGRGKTAISEIIAHSFLSAGKVYDKEDVIMIAPTGRAAQRITESTGYSASTAHRIIMSARAGNTPKGKLILVDESSMIDIFLMKGLLEYGKECNIIFVGDIDQIASVGPGKVLRDMISCGRIPCILLKKGHRNTGTIAHNSELINAGMKIDKYVYDKNFVYIPAKAENIADILVNDYVQKVKEYGIKNVMLCVAMRKRGCSSVDLLNKKLQDIYTSGKEELKIGDKIFRVGDRVMQIHNDYNFHVKRNGEITLGIFNGERGTITSISYVEEYDDYYMLVLFDDGSIGRYSRAKATNLTLAYATTLHKCQGSEAECMMMSYVFGDYLLLNRSLFYTGETRAKKEFRFYGEEQYKYGKLLSAFDIAVSKTEDNNRNTRLSERIIENLDNM